MSSYANPTVPIPPNPVFIDVAIAKLQNLVGSLTWLTHSFGRSYIKIKKALNQPTYRVTLKLTGDFHKSFFVNIGNESFRIDAKDKKTKHLVKRYGERVFGLTDDNVELFQELVVRPDLLKQLRRKIIK